MTTSETGDSASTLYQALSRIAFGQRSQTETMSHLAGLAHDALPESPEVSVTLLQGQQAETVAFSGSLAKDLDERQYEDGRGPCLDAAVAGTTIMLDMEAADGSYPDFVRAAVRQQVSHTMSIGFEAIAGPLGAMNVYNQTGQPFTAQSRELAATVAASMSVFLANLNLYQNARRLGVDLQAALESRAIIEQAKGIIMSREHCSSDAAFASLARLSQNQNRKLRDLAEAIVQRAVTGK